MILIKKEMKEKIGKSTTTGVKLLLVVICMKIESPRLIMACSDFDLLGMH